MKCEYCGKDFEGRKRKYCCKECCQEAYKKKQREEWASSPKSKRQTHCEMCGVELPKYKSRFCCTECKSRYNHIKTGAVSHSEPIKKICVVCGKEFETWKSRQLTCSHECSVRAHASDRRIRGKVVDRGITLEKLARRDNNQCRICGLFVDWGDVRKTGKTTICGGMYPSVDHITPLSLGGLHAWNNVQLAHIRCNTVKGNRYIG